MSSPLTRKSTNHSDLEKFAFSFYCDICGKLWKSRIIPFEKAGFTAVEHKEAQQLIWTQEHKAAFEQANLEAHCQFNFCKQCGRWVCDDCFDADGNGKNGLCIDCV